MVWRKNRHTTRTCFVYRFWETDVWTYIWIWSQSMVFKWHSPEILENYGLSRNDKFPRRATGQLLFVALVFFTDRPGPIGVLHLPVTWRLVHDPQQFSYIALCFTTQSQLLHCLWSLFEANQGRIQRSVFFWGGGGASLGGGGLTYPHFQVSPRIRPLYFEIAEFWYLFFILLNF